MRTVVSICLLFIAGIAHAVVLSPFLPHIQTPQKTKKASAVHIPEAPSLPAEDTTYFEEKPRGEALQGVIIEHGEGVRIDTKPLKTVAFKEGQSISTDLISQAEITIADIHIRLWQESNLRATLLRSYTHHNEIVLTLSAGRMRIKPGKGFIGSIRVETPQEKILSHNADCMIHLAPVATVWNINGSVEIINKNQRLILMPGERADRRGSVWSVSAVLNPKSLRKLTQKFAMRSEHTPDVVSNNTSRHYVKTKKNLNQP